MKEATNLGGLLRQLKRYKLPPANLGFIMGEQHCDCRKTQRCGNCYGNEDEPKHSNASIAELILKRNHKDMVPLFAA
jgi:hypothetical protein